MGPTPTLPTTHFNMKNPQLSIGFEQDSVPAESNQPEKEGGILVHLDGTNDVMVYESPPPIVEGVVQVPYEPHIFPVSIARIYLEGSSGTPETLDLEGVTVLMMHGETRWGEVFPKYFESGIGGHRVVDIIKAYERQTGKHVDVLAVCTGEVVGYDGDSNLVIRHSQYRKQPIRGLEDTVHTIYDKAAVPLYIDNEGRTILEMRGINPNMMWIPNRFKERSTA